MPDKDIVVDVVALCLLQVLLAASYDAELDTEEFNNSHISEDVFNRLDVLHARLKSSNASNVPRSQVRDPEAKALKDSEAAEKRHDLFTLKTAADSTQRTEELTRMWDMADGLKWFKRDTTKAAFLNEWTGTEEGRSLWAIYSAGHQWVNNTAEEKAAATETARAALEVKGYTGFTVETSKKGQAASRAARNTNFAREYFGSVNKPGECGPHGKLCSVQVSGSSITLFRMEGKRIPISRTDGIAHYQAMHDALSRTIDEKGETKVFVKIIGESIVVTPTDSETEV